MHRAARGLRAGAARLRRELRVWILILRHPRTPRLAKLLLGLAIAYTLTPIDLIPDFIPVIGHLDDLLIVPALVALALWLVPAEIKQECRELAATPP
jgi:uncharacterized membrane protein YkvA (DUF1232 family)